MSCLVFELHQITEDLARCNRMGRFGAPQVGLVNVARVLSTRLGVTYFCLLRGTH